MSEELDSATVDDLVAALAKKCPAFVLAVCVPDDGAKCDYRLYTSGNLICQRGLADEARDTVRRRIRKQTAQT